LARNRDLRIVRTYFAALPGVYRLEPKESLSARARKRIVELADDHDLRWRAPRSFWHSAVLGADPQRDPRLPPAGTVLKRVYGQRTIEVTVLEHGFEYQGQPFASLSLIAQRVTGTRWNGYLFFGLQNEHGR
jgi:Protein of unknown function (DUF2924)